MQRCSTRTNVPSLDRIVQNLETEEPRIWILGVFDYPICSLPEIGRFLKLHQCFVSLCTMWRNRIIGSANNLIQQCNVKFSLEKLLCHSLDCLGSVRHARNCGRASCPEEECLRFPLEVDGFVSSKCRMCSNVAPEWIDSPQTAMLRQLSPRWD